MDKGAEELRGWFQGRVPDDWFVGAPEVAYDRDEILVVGTLAEPKLEKGASQDVRTAAFAARGQRMRIADEAEATFDRKISWGAEVGGQRELFTTQAIPAMTRLRLPERQVLDTLVESGVARSRSHALAWCVRLVAERQDEWFKDLRDALGAVEKVRAEGPKA
jgi:hypothetical protein